MKDHDEYEKLIELLEDLFGCAETVHPHKNGASPCGAGTTVLLYAIGGVALKLHQTVTMGGELDQWVAHTHEDDPCLTKALSI